MRMTLEFNENYKELFVEMSKINPVFEGWILKCDCGRDSIHFIFKKYSKDLISCFCEKEYRVFWDKDRVIAPNGLVLGREKFYKIKSAEDFISIEPKETNAN